MQFLLDKWVIYAHNKLISDHLDRWCLCSRSASPKFEVSGRILTRFQTRFVPHEIVSDLSCYNKLYDTSHIIMT